MALIIAGVAMPPVFRAAAHVETAPTPAAGSMSDDPYTGPVFLSGGRVREVGEPRRYRVYPNKRIRIHIRHVGTISGGRHTVSKPGIIRVRKFEGKVKGLTTAGIGLDVAFRGMKLLKPLKLTQKVAKGPAGTVPAFAHLRHDGSWELKPAKIDKYGRMVVRTRKFSLNLPSWLNVGSVANVVGGFLAQYIGGRTTPVTCPKPAPEWFTVSNLTVTTHACGQDNPAAGNAPRAEIRIKNNRAVVQQVDLAGPRDFVYVQGQPDALRKAIGLITGTDPATTVFLAPGDDGYMTVGYRQPGTSMNVTNHVQSTRASVYLTYAYLAIGALADVVSKKAQLIAAVDLAQDCLGIYDISNGALTDPTTAISNLDFADIFACVVDNATDLADPKKAFQIALSLTDGKLIGMTTSQLTDELTKVGKRLVTFGVLFKFLSLGTLLVQVLQTFVDSLFALVTEGTSTEINLALTAPSGPPPSPPPTPSPTPQPPASVTVVADNRVTNGATAMREDDQPAYLSTVTANFCKRDGCALPGTDFWSGANLVAECTVIGNRTTNGQDNSSIDDSNPGLYTSYRWYGIRWGDGRFGYVSEVWLAAPYRGGLGLRTC
jgi:hypothetical protein